jgi:hypothetical protein
MESITLNIPYDLTEVEWEKVMLAYREMGEFVEGEQVACWLGPLDSERFIAASVEPSGLLVSGTVDPLLFRGWVTKLCAKLTTALGREIYDAEV